MLKFNFLALTFIISIGKREMGEEELASIQRIKKIEESQLDRRAHFPYFK